MICIQVHHKGLDSDNETRPETRGKISQGIHPPYYSITPCTWQINWRLSGTEKGRQEVSVVFQRQSNAVVLKKPVKKKKLGLNFIKLQRADFRKNVHSRRG